MNLVFEWGENKAKANIKRHKVSFNEAKTVFGDPFLMTFPDPDHTDSEPRYISLGYSVRGRVLVVIHTPRGENIRLISCRKATASEHRFYEEGDI